MGYDINRFANGNVSDEFICPICKNVLQEPLLVETCEHIFCKECILQRFSIEEKCPIDKNNMSFKQLREPIRSFKNLLGQLKINCQFASLGCKQCFKLDEIESHLAKCTYCPPKPNHIECICGLKLTDIELIEHKPNCITHLQNQLNQLKLSFEEMKKKEKIKNSGVKSLFDEWVSSGKEIKVLNSDMSAEMKLDSLTLIKEGLISNDINFLKKLTDFFNKKYGDNWFALMFDIFNKYSYAKGTYLLVSIGQKKLRLFKALQFSIKETINESQTIAKPQIIKNTMNLLMTDDAITFASRAIFVGEDFLQISSLIRQRFDEKYGKNWNCFTSADNFGLSYAPKQKTLINLKFGDLFIVIWQCP